MDRELSIKETSRMIRKRAKLKLRHLKQAILKMENLIHQRVSLTPSRTKTSKIETKN